MNDQLTITETPAARATAEAENIRREQFESSRLADAKQLRTEHVGALLGEAYKGASQVKLKDHEWKKLREDFPDSAIEIRPHDGLIYLNHMLLRERLWDVLGPGVAEIPRERFFKSETSEIAVDLVLMVRGSFVAEAIGMAKYYPQNPKTSFGDAVESAWSDALRRCCKHWGVGTQVWRPGYVREWLAKNATQLGGKWQRKDQAPPQKGRAYTLKEPSTFQETKAAMQTAPSEDKDDVPF